MKLVTKLLLLVLAALMCVGCFASCGGGSTTTTTTTTTGTPVGPDTPDGPEDGGPHQITLLDNKTFSGQTCTIWFKGGSFGPGTPLWIEEPGVSAVDRASYKRLQTIAERTGVTIEGQRSPYDGASMTTEDIGFLRDLFEANDYEQIPDIVMPGGYAASILAGEGLFLDLGADNPYIDLDLDCWQKSVNDALSICGTYYGIAGLFSTSNTGETACVYFDNTALATIDTTLLADTAAAGFEDRETLYEWARNGEWTYKKLLALAAVFAGENGSVQHPGAETDGDRYGLEYQGTSCYSIFMATGKKYMTGDPENNGIPALMTDDPDTMKVLNWLVENVQSKPYVHDAGGGDGMTGKYHWGLAHDVLFSVDMVRQVAIFSALGAANGGQGTFDFGVLPMPKYDYEEGQTQESYHCALNAWFATLAAIPKNCRDTAFSSFVLELITEMGYYAWDEDVSTIWDAYVKDGLQGRYAPNPADEEMLDLIMSSVTADMGEFNVLGVYIANEIRDMYRNRNTGWIGWTDRNRGTVDSAIMKMLEDMGLITYS